MGPGSLNETWKNRGKTSIFLCWKKHGRIRRRSSPQGSTIPLGDQIPRTVGDRHWAVAQLSTPWLMKYNGGPTEGHHYFFDPAYWSNMDFTRPDPTLKWKPPVCGSLLELGGNIKSSFTCTGQGIENHRVWKQLRLQQLLQEVQGMLPFSCCFTCTDGCTEANRILTRNEMAHGADAAMVRPKLPQGAKMVNSWNQCLACLASAQPRITRCKTQLPQEL